jgi:hypothetical protein
MNDKSVASTPLLNKSRSGGKGGSTPTSAIDYLRAGGNTSGEKKQKV